MSDDFGLRCRSALAHPITAAALCLPVVNDWLLKPVWQDKKFRLGRIRVRLSLVAALIATLASAASTHAFNPPQGYGDAWRIGKLEDGALFISSRYRSDDGGLSWTAMDKPPDHDSVVEWGSDGVDTPKGLYVVRDSRIVLKTDDGELEPAYSIGYLSDDSNKLFQQFM